MGQVGNHGAAFVVNDFGLILHAFDAGLHWSVRETLMKNAFLGLFVVLLVVWVLSWIVWQIASGLIHLLLVVAFVALIFHLLQRRR